MRSNLLVSSILVPLLACFSVFAVSCTSIPADDPVAVARQATADAVDSLPSGYTQPKTGYDVPDSPRLEGWLDVNQYFSVLNHLSMQPGYTLDYIYHNSGSGAQPYLYARKIDTEPYSTLGELVKIYQNEISIDPTKDSENKYLARVQTDDTEESFFQYVVLRKLGGQFYLWWHAAYNDDTIICEHNRLEKLFANMSDPFKPPSDIEKKARRLDFAPKVEKNKDTVSVRVVIFTRWGGFIEETYIITRAFPHVIKDIKIKTLVEWYCKVTF